MSKKVKVSRFSSANNAPKPPSGRFLLFGLFALVLLIVGFVGGRSTVNTGSKKSAAVSERKTPIGDIASVSDIGPKKKVNRVPVGYAHEADGAVAAATGYIGVTPQLYLTTESEFDLAVKTMSSASFTSSMREGLLASRTIMKGYFDADPNAFYREIPVANSVVLAEKDRVQVSIYTIVMLVAQPDFDGRTEGKMHNIELVWEDGDWKVSNWSTESAPTPKWSSPVPLSSLDVFTDTVGSMSGGYNYVPNL